MIDPRSDVEIYVALARRHQVSITHFETRYAANILGGLLFGAGIALLGYCPGTVAAALDKAFGMRLPVSWG